MSKSKTPNKLKPDTNRLVDLASVMSPSLKEAIELINQKYSKEIESLTKDEQQNWSKLLSSANMPDVYALTLLFEMGYSLGARLPVRTEKLQKEFAKLRQQLPFDEKRRLQRLVKEQVLRTASELLKVRGNGDLDHFQLAELARNEFKRELSEEEDADPIKDGLHEALRAKIPEVTFHENETKKHDTIADWLKESDLEVKKPRRGRRKKTK